MKLLSCLLKKSQWPQRVLGISKLCAFEFLKATNPALSCDQLLDQLKKLSKECKEIIKEHQRQLVYEKEFARVLRNLNVSYRIIKNINDADKHMSWADLVIVIGGDCTFVLASKLITNNRMPIFGINPHPSTDDILTLPMEYSMDIDRIFERLRAGNYNLLMRSRIRTIMTGIGLYEPPLLLHEKSLRPDKKNRIDEFVNSTREKLKDTDHPYQRILPWLALNEVFITELISARSIKLEVQTNDDEKALKCCSSGAYILTGTGSRFLKQPQIESIQTIVAMATGRQLDKKEIDELLYKYRRKHLFSPEDSRLIYTIYEMNQSLRQNSMLFYKERSLCHRLRIKSFGFNAGLVLDGYLYMPFNHGTTALFQILPEYSLKNIVLS